jgi:transcriptional regulator with XRE-family HTH domain
MTDYQAEQLGDLIRRARAKKGLTLFGLADLAEMDDSWLARLERGRYTTPNPAQLARLAEILDIDPARIDRLTHDYLADSMPSTRTYLRSKEKLSPEAMDALERALDEIRAEDAGRRAARGGAETTEGDRR